MMDALLIYALELFFAFYLVNHSEVFIEVRTWLWPRLPAPVLFALGCGFCFTWWSTLALLIAGVALPASFLFAAPSLVMLLNCTFLWLNREPAQ